MDGFISFVAFIIADVSIDVNEGCLKMPKERVQKVTVKQIHKNNRLSQFRRDYYICRQQIHEKINQNVLIGQKGEQNYTSSYDR